MAIYSKIAYAPHRVDLSRQLLGLRLIASERARVQEADQRDARSERCRATHMIQIDQVVGPAADFVDKV